MAIFQRLSKDQPERGASSGWRPGFACRRQNHRFAFPSFGRRHARAETCVTHPTALQLGSMTTRIRCEPDGFQQAAAQRTRLCDP